MKKFIVVVAIIASFYSCDTGGKPTYCPEYKTILSISPHHSTRAFVTYLCKHGDTISISIHHSATMKFENGTYDIGDYTSGRKPYGEIKNNLK